MGLIGIGDVHGCVRSLEALLETLSPNSDDHLVFVGDYIDRGPNSRGVINLLLELREAVTCTFLRGNHEALMLDYFDQGEFELWSMNGGLETLESYRTADRTIQVPETHVEFVRDTELYFETDQFLFVHAGLRPNATIAENLENADERIFLWERNHLNATRRAWEKTVVCGHTPHGEPVNEDKLILIDTGCVYYHHPRMGKLTAVRLPEREFVSVQYSG
jgi:serine/threonine protein phosphatase 1